MTKVQSSQCPIYYACIATTCSWSLISCWRSRSSLLFLATSKSLPLLLDHCDYATATVYSLRSTITVGFQGDFAPPGSSERKTPSTESSSQKVGDHSTEHRQPANGRDTQGIRGRTRGRTRGNPLLCSVRITCTPLLGVCQPMTDPGLSSDVSLQRRS